MLLRKKQSGVTLIEMMIAMVIGLIVLAAAITIFIITIKANSDNVKMIRLTQELRSVMSLVTRDIRRTGYWAGTVSTNTYLSTWNNGVTAGNTLAMSYDANWQGDADAGDSFSYTLDGNEMKLTLNGAQSSLTDSGVVTVTGLSFDVTKLTLTGAEVRNVKVTIIGQLKSDASVSRTLVETVKVRNDVKL